MVFFFSDTVVPHEDVLSASKTWRMYLPFPLPKGDYCVRLLYLPSSPDMGLLRGDLFYQTADKPSWKNQTGRVEVEDKRKYKKHSKMTFSLAETARNMVRLWDNAKIFI